MKARKGSGANGGVYLHWCHVGPMILCTIRVCHMKCEDGAQSMMVRSFMEQCILLLIIDVHSSYHKHQQLSVRECSEWSAPTSCSHEVKKSSDVQG